jgi:hypothetical protein
MMLSTTTEGFRSKQHRIASNQHSPACTNGQQAKISRDVLHNVYHVLPNKTFRMLPGTILKNLLVTQIYT